MVQALWTEAVIGLGSNVGDGQKNIWYAWQRLGVADGITLLSMSSPYHTEPVGMASSNWFINCVGLLATDMPPSELLAKMLGIEKAMGRIRLAPNQEKSDRIIDLDLLYYGDSVCRRPQLTVPHPGMQNRFFVLAPLAELLPDKQHPVLGLTSSQMLARFMSSTDRSAGQPEVRKMCWQKDTFRLRT
jgi:2-amino-4-hydroxy-6-hydroxymethyldihydropteridine diphosphokinase